MRKGAVITGPTGAIGTALTEELVSEGYYVMLLTHTSSPRKSQLPIGNDIDYIEVNLEEYGLRKQEIADDIRDRCPEVKFELFFHLAWLGTFGIGRNDFSLQVKNIQATLDAVEIAAELNCKVFLGTGSQAEYGRVRGKLSPDTPVFPENGYGMAKLCAGQMSRELCEKYGIRHEWVRILSIYGPNDGEKSLISVAIKQMLANDSTQFTKGEQIWDYLYSADAARALRLIAQEGKNKAIYVLGSGVTRPLSDYIKIIAEETDYKKEIGFGKIPYSERQTMHLEADITALKNDTGFVPRYSFREGIRETILHLSRRAKY